ncbi:MAG TPA: sodium:proton antiporter [Thermoplasmata archaeon]|nr:sodium:proton antiporter [Thermoplasmata archaeon]
MREMSKVVRTVSNILFPFILIFGFYIVLHGHLTPGGGFQGGAVIGSAVALIIAAHGSRKALKLFNKNLFSLGESGGLLLFIGLAFAGLSTAFFYNFITGEDFIFGESVEYGINSGNLNTGGTVPLMNIFVGLEVVSAFGVILLALLSGLKYNKGEEEEMGGEN